MKGKLVFLLLFSLFLTQSAAQKVNYPILSLQQYPGHNVDFRIRYMHALRDDNFTAYINALNLTVRQDYSDPSRYVLSLNPALWTAEYIMRCLFWDKKNANSVGVDWLIAIPEIIIITDIISNAFVDIYWLHIGWNTDYYIYEKKFYAVFEALVALKYEYKRAGLYVGVKIPAREPLKFMPPFGGGNKYITIGFTYRFDNSPVAEYIGWRGKALEH